MVQYSTLLHYLWITVKVLYHVGTRMPVSMWLYAFTGLTAMIGIYCLIHVVKNMWTTTTSVLFFIPKLYMKFVDYLMNYVEEPHCHLTDHHHHQHLCDEHDSDNKHRRSPTIISDSSAEDRLEQ